MQDYGLVSIITPTYNCGRFIGETIESVKSQSYCNWEMLIVDDCSTDNTQEIVESYAKNDPRIQYHCLEKNSGAAVARNTALKLAKGSWIAFLDSDDLWKPQKLERQLKFMIDNNYKFSYTEHDSINEDGSQTRMYVTGPSHVNKLGMFCFCWVGCLTVMYKNDIETIQIPNLKKNNDYAIWLKVIKYYDCYLLKENLSTYRIRKGSISHDKLSNLIRSHYELYRISEKMNPLESYSMVGLNCISAIIKKLSLIHI